MEALRNAARAIEASADYQWGHMGLCNCGFLAQEVTHLHKGEIHSRAMQQCGDWSEQLCEYCPTSGLPMDDLISQMIAFGFDADDLRNLERLSDKKVLLMLRDEGRNIKHNVKADVVAYLNGWASMLESVYLEKIELPDLSPPAKVPI
jgi:hypothetical protein